jgi:hypothetical protein
MADGGMSNECVLVQAQLAAMVNAARRARVFKVGEYPGPLKKRRHVQPYVLADVSDNGALTELRAALTVKGCSDFVCMCMGELIFELLDDDRQIVGVFNFAAPDELRWETSLARPLLADPQALGSWLRHWAPAAAAILPAEHA